jgi:hypothetical protein
MTTLARIRKKVRRLTATPSVIQLPDSEIDEYIDTFYLQDFPAHLKLFELHKTYHFFTEANIDRYALPVNTNFSVNPPVYIAGYQSFYTQSREEFFRLYPKLAFSQDIGNGDGTAGAYPFTLTNIPVLQRQFSVSAVDTNGDDVTIEDDGDGNLVVPGSVVNRGTINYVTGVGTVTFPNAIPATSTINTQSVPYAASRPTAVLFFDNFFTLRPVPDMSYRVSIEVYQSPSQLLDVDTDEPDIQQWWQYIAFGAAMKILEDRNDTETMLALEPRLDEQKQLVLHRTIVQQTTQRTPTIYTEQSTNYYGNWFQGIN